ncbi:MAG: class I SAM-dependent methyltransferase [Candidatus Omnitrophica bacterium]|nr:class I SAM-dependent methyltransferase [Candidatus Omnitrophota bacterium]
MNPHEIELESVACPLCESSSHQRLISVQLSPIRIETDLLRCRDCGLGYLSPRPTREYEKRFYAETHYELESETAWKEDRLPFFKRAIAEIEKKSKRRKLLDVGCGGGFFMDLARSRGWKVEGTELSIGGLKHAREVLTLDVFPGEIYESVFTPRSFSVVTLWNVLDQMYDPVKQLKKIGEIMEPKGLLAMRISNLSFHLPVHRFWQFCVKKKMIASDKEPPTVFHLQMFDAGSVRKCLLKAGFEQITVKNSVLDVRNIIMTSFFGKKGACAVGWMIHGLFEIVRILTLGTVVIGPSLIIYARRPGDE